MRRFFKGVVTLAAAAVMLATPIAPQAAGNVDANEQSVLDWIEKNTEKGINSVAYETAKEQFEYTTKQMTEAQAQTIKDNVKKADELKKTSNTDLNQSAKMLEYAKAAAEAAGAKVAPAENCKTLDTSVLLVRVDENDPSKIIKVVETTDGKTTSQVTATKVISVDGEKKLIVKGETPSTPGVYTTDDGQEVYQTTDGKVQEVKEAASPITVTYATHVQSKGDTAAVKNGATSGTTGIAKRLEAIKISVSGNKDLGIAYTTHCQTYGWLPWASNNEVEGTTGEAKRLEAIKIKLTGSAAGLYDVYYRVHAQSYGWLNWASNGENAGTAGLAKRLEAIQIVVVPKGTFDAKKYSNPASTEKACFVKAKNASSEAPEAVVPTVMYKTHVQTFGWQNWVTNGTVSGTEGKAKRLEGINIKLTNKDYEGGIEYSTHVQTYGWQKFVANGALAGTTGQAKRLEAIKINLTGEMAKHYDVYYRVHVQTYGWMNWAKNGEAAGTSGQAKRLEGIQVVVVPKGQQPPATYLGVTSKNSVAYIGK